MPDSGEASLSDADQETALFAIIDVEEAARSAAFAMLCIVVGTVCLACLTFLGGDATARAVCAGALVSIIAASTWTIVQMRKPNPKVTQTMRVFGSIAVNAVVAVEYYIGFFSPVPVVLSLGVYYVGMARDTVFAVLCATHLIVGWCLGASLIGIGMIDDRGLYPLGELPAPRVAFVVVAVTLTLVSAWFAARLSRAALWHAVKTAHEALVQVDNREALLAEAQNQLDRAMRLAVDQPGRYTGRLAGEHRLDVVIGFGAMGEVYSATRETDSMPGAVKLLRPDALEDAKLVDRFLREASICQRLTHPNVVQIREVGKLDEGAPFMAMELLKGQDLAALLRRHGRLPWPEVVKLGHDLAAALDHAHRAGVIHRDLKPHNVFQAYEVDDKRTWKILDFGISKLLTGQATLTQDGVVGTPSYMSPEQAQALPTDHRSDIFAMSAVLYRAATGRPAFPGKDTPGIMFDVVYRMPQRPTAVASDLPPDCDLLLAIGLAKAPEDRFGTAGELAAALASIDEGRLDARLRRKARRLLAKKPWGHAGAHAMQRPGEPSGGIKLGGA